MMFPALPFTLKDWAAYAYRTPRHDVLISEDIRDLVRHRQSTKKSQGLCLDQVCDAKYGRVQVSNGNREREHRVCFMDLIAEGRAEDALKMAAGNGMTKFFDLDLQICKTIRPGVYLFSRIGLKTLRRLVFYSIYSHSFETFKRVVDQVSEYVSRFYHREDTPFEDELSSFKEILAVHGSSKMVKYLRKQGYVKESFRMGDFAWCTVSRKDTDLLEYILKTEYKIFSKGRKTFVMDHAIMVENKKAIRVIFKYFGRDAFDGDLVNMYEHKAIADFIFSEFGYP